MNPLDSFYEEKQLALRRYSSDGDLEGLTRNLIQWCFNNRYMYHFEALGRPIVQFPADIIAVQEIIWRVKPDIIIETGIAHGGSIVNSAQLLAILDLADALAENKLFGPTSIKRRVIAIDIDIRKHNRDLIESHPLSSYIEMIEGSSVDPKIISQVREASSGSKSVLVLLDSNHTNDHVLTELEAYGSLVTTSSFCVVFDTVIEELPTGYFFDRPWDTGNSPLSAVDEFLATSELGKKFVKDEEYNIKLVLSGCRGGYLRRI